MLNGCRAQATAYIQLTSRDDFCNSQKRNLPSIKRKEEILELFDTVGTRFKLPDRKCICFRDWESTRL